MIDPLTTGPLNRCNLPPALPGEASFASSGTCVATQGGKNAWIATGASTIARILATHPDD